MPVPPKEQTAECFTDLPSPARKKIRLVRAKVVHAMFPWRFAKSKKHEKRRDDLKKNARAPSTNKGLLCCTGYESPNPRCTRASSPPATT